MNALEGQLLNSFSLIEFSRRVIDISTILMFNNDSRLSN